MLRSTVVILVLIFFGCSSSSFKISQYTKIRESKLPNGLVVHEYKLENGMQLLLVPDHSAPVFTFQVWLPIGSAYERLDKRLNYTGLAHLFEHMMFRGTYKYPGDQFDKMITSKGGVGLNATTWFDRTNYFESLPKESLEMVFDLESDRMVNLKLDRKLFDTEKGAVFGELKMGLDNPSRYASYLLWESAFKIHPYRYRTIGLKEELERMTLEDAQYFYKTYYSPNNATVIIVGDIDLEDTLRLAVKYYGPLQAQKIPKMQVPKEPRQNEARRVVQAHSQARNKILSVGFKTVELGHPDIATLHVIASILAYGHGSLLEKSLVDGGLASSMSASQYELRYPSLFTIRADLVKSSSEGRVQKEIWKAINRIKNGKLSARELKRAINQLLLYQYNHIGSNSGLGNIMGEALVSSGDYLRSFAILEEIKQVSLSAVQRVAKKYFNEKSMTSVLLTPPKGH